MVSKEEDLISSLKEDEEGDFLRSDLVTTPDNTTISEELSRFSSSPSRSQSSSCTSITNPFYDGLIHHSVSTETPRQELLSSGDNQESSTAGGDGQTSGEEHDEDMSRTGGSLQQHPTSRPQLGVVVVWNFGHLLTCAGFLQLLQVVLTVATLSCLTSAGAAEGGLLNLPLSWHFRIMLFVLVLTLLTTVATLVGHLTSLLATLGFEWVGFDMVLYSLFAFLFLVGSSLVASAFDFYQKMRTGVSTQTIDRLVTSVIMGYLLMVLYGITAALSYRQWKLQYRLYQRRKLIEEDEIDL